MPKRLFLVFFLLCSTFIFAQDFADGDGSEGNPYQVATAQHLSNVRNYSSSFFIQTSDIDLSSYSGGEGWEPIPILTGRYDGQYHTITNLTINKPTTNNLGLFNIIDGSGGFGCVRNLVITNANITAEINAGVLAAAIINNASIVNCGAEGTVFGSQTIGGLIGTSNLGSLIENSFARCTVTGNQTVGGIVGQLLGGGTMNNCYYKGTIADWGGTPANLAGISGITNSSAINFCFATGTTSSMNFPGITADDNSNSIIANCYVNEDYFLTNNGIGIMAATAAMKDQSSFTSWDYIGESANGNNDYWSIDVSKNDGYPYLTWENLIGAGDPQTTNLTLAELGWTQIRLTWTKGTGERRSVFMKPGSGENYTPVQRWYSVDQTFGAASDDNGWYCVYDGTGDGAIIKGLNASTEYTVQVFDYDGANGSQTFDTDITPDENSKVFSTIAPGFPIVHGDIDTALVQCADQLNKIRDMEHQYYKQDRDIDLSGFSDGEGWVPLRNVPDNEFYGTYDGNGYEIRNLFINDPDGTYIGLFSTTWTGSTIKNVNLVNVNVTGQYAVGGLLGWGRTGPNCSPGTIINCTVSGTVSGQSAVGGLVGSINGWNYEYKGVIKYCSSSAEVTGTFQYAGGLIGSMENEQVYDSYATGNVTGVSGVGGFLGHMNSRCLVQNCYSLGTTSGSNDVGNLIGNYFDDMGSGHPNNSRIVNSYYNTDIEATKRVGTEYGFPLTSNQLKDTENLWGWDFVSVWNINPGVNNGYPHLQYIEPTAPVTQATNISFADVTTGSMTINWTNGSGAARVVFVKRIESGGADPSPLTNSTYIPNTSYGSGTEMAGGSYWYCVYNGTGSNVSVNNLAPGTTYNVKIFEYNGPAGSQVYNTTEGAGNQSTQKTASDFASGDGSDKNPYQLTSTADFLYIRNYSGKYFELTGNVDLSGFTDNGGWAPFGDNITPFNNNFNGNGFTIDGLYIGIDNPVGTSYMGLFGAVAPGVEIKNVKLTNVNITAQSYVGALAGKNEGQISNCQVVSGTITIPGNNAEAFAGGLIGTNLGTLDNCYATITINGNNNRTIGGLVGLADGTGPGAGTITNCYSAGQLTGSTYIGGLAGSASSNAEINNCYSLSNINAVDYCGGFIGSNSSNITNCYSIGSVGASVPTNVGGFIGENTGGAVITSCYWNTESSGLGSDPAASGKNTTEMTTDFLSTYTDWDFLGTWSIESGKNYGYPFLQASGEVLPVELTSFTALAEGNKVNLTWVTATEVNNYGFEVERASLGTTPGQVGSRQGTVGNRQSAVGNENNTQWIKVGFVAGAGNSNSPKKYSFEDTNAPAGNLQYRLKQIDSDGKSYYYPSVADVNYTITGVEEKQLPTEYTLNQNYPNPFNPATNIKFALVNSGFVTLKIYDILGNEVAVLVNEYKNPGFYNLQFNAASLASGVYIYRLTAGSFISTKKLMLMK